MIEQNYDIGGHAIESGGNIALGGGTSLQKKYGIEDSPDKMFEDLVHWHDYRFSDREIVRAFCDESVATFDFLLAHGVKFPDKHPIGPDGGPQNVMRAQTVTWTGEVSAYSPNGRQRHGAHAAARSQRQETGRANSSAAQHDRPRPRRAIFRQSFGNHRDA